MSWDDIAGSIAGSGFGLGGEEDNPERPSQQKTTWHDVAHYIGRLSGQILKGAADVPGYALDVGKSVADVVNYQAPDMSGVKNAVLGAGPAVQATNKALFPDMPAPKNKTEQRIDMIGQAIGASIFPMGEIKGAAGIAKAAVGGAVAGTAMEAANEATDNNPWAGLAAGIVGGAIAHHAVGGRPEISVQDLADQHPEYGDLIHRVIPALEGGGTLENPKVNPKTGAMGIMQVTPETARDPGYGIKPWDGKSQEDLARVGQQKFAVLLRRYDGDTSKALAAYNWGEGNVDHAIETHGNSWLDHAPHETQDYVNKGMAMVYGGNPLRAGSTGQPVAPMDLSGMPNPAEDHLQGVLQEGEAENVANLSSQRAKQIIQEQQQLNDTLSSHLDEAHMALEDLHNGDVPDVTPTEVKNFQSGINDIIKGMDQSHPLYSKAFQAGQAWNAVAAAMEDHPVAAKPEVFGDAADRHLGYGPDYEAPANDATEATPPPEVTNNAGSGEPPREPPQEPPAGNGGSTGGEPPEDTPRGRLQKAIQDALLDRPKQDKMISEQRGERISNVAQVAQHTTGVERYHAALAQLKGEMNNYDFHSVAKNLQPGDVAALHDEIWNSTHLNYMDKVNASNGLAKLTSEGGGVLPYQSELEQLEKVFPEIVKPLKQNKDLWDKIKEGTASVLNVPRALMTSADLSAPFRQGVFLVGHKEFWTNMPRMAKAAFSKEFHDAVWNEIQARPSYKWMQRSGLSFSSVDGPLSDREEAFMSRLAEKIPVIGRVVGASNRAYVTYLNRLRADVFDKIMYSWKDMDIDYRNMGRLKQLSKFINAATGRGDLGKYNDAAPLLSATFFSPRLQMSRAMLLNPIYYTRMDPLVRKEAMKSLLGFGAFVATTLGLAKAGGASVSLDVSSPDGLKIKIGNTRFDVMGGFAQYIRLVTEFAQYNNDVLLHDKEPREGKTFNDVMGHFLRGKSAPVLGTLMDIYGGKKEVTGEKISESRAFGMKGWDAYIAKRFIPFVLQDMSEAYNEHGSVGLLVGIPSFMGVGVQTYKKRPAKATGSSPFDEAFGGMGKGFDEAFGNPSAGQ